ncbi:MAG TPA: S8 family peptidase, partial [Vicinamibacteria bacterium]|nr:S8 family peptidase [Vicinamibacteria bacterium]
VVAIIDTGILPHPDLAGRILPGFDFISDTKVANDGNGRDPDPSDPGDWVTAEDLQDPDFADCTVESSSWHGTAVSGLVAADTDNAQFIAGMSWGARILPVRALGKCGGYDSDILAGMRWAAGLGVPGAPANPHPARVINLSLGGDGACSVAYQEAIDEIEAAGTAIVAAAGNSSGHAVGSPANCRGVIAVAGLRHVGTKVGFSALGSEVAVSAPAGNCVNTGPGSACLFPILAATDSGDTVPVSSTYTDSYNYSVGTSFSTPLVAAVAALVLSVHPGMKPEEVALLLKSSARPFPAVGSVGGSSTVPECTLPQYSLRGTPVDQEECYCTTSTCGAGMLDAGAALGASGSAASRERPSVRPDRQGGR